MKLIQLKTNGELAILEGNDTLKLIQEGVDGWIEAVTLDRYPRSGNTLTMWVNEEYMLRTEQRFNPGATLLLWDFVEAHRQAKTIIYGNVVFSSTDHHGNTIPAPNFFLNGLFSMFRQGDLADEYLNG